MENEAQTYSLWLEKEMEKEVIEEGLPSWNPWSPLFESLSF